MAILTKKSRPQDLIPTSSMADIAFLLLIFFLVSTVFPKDRGLALVLPETTGEVSAGNVLFFLIQDSGLIEVKQGESQLSEVVPVHRVAALWRSHVADNPLLIAAVKTSPDAPYGRMVDVLDELHAAGAQRVSLQVLPR